MKNKFIKKEVLSFLLTFFLGGMFMVHSSGSQDTIPLDRSIRHGKLLNGLEYYIKPIKDGSSQLDVRLLIKAGSALENEYESAHFMEHIAFKSGKHMTIEKAQDLGFKIGQINGSASFDFTQYFFESVGTKEQREIAFQLCQDIIWNLEFKDEYINSERGVIINEKAQRGGYLANSLISDFESVMIGRGATPPIDFIKHIEHFKKKTLKRFYKDWYRTDLMAIVVIGDIKDVDLIENEIKEKFSKTKPNKNLQSPINNYEEYRNSFPQFISEEHPFLKKNSKDDAVYMRLYMRQKIQEEVYGLNVLKNDQKRQLFMNILREMLITKQQQQYATSFYVLPAFIKPFSLGIALQIRIEDGSEKEVISESIQLLKQLKSKGFSKREFMEGKKKQLRSLNKKDTTGIHYWRNNIRDHFIYRKALPSNKKAILTKLIRELTLTEFNKFIKQYIKTNPNDIDIIILSPPNHHALSYTEKEIRRWIKDANNSPVSEFKELRIPEVLLSPSTIRNLKPSKIQEKVVSIPGAKEYQLDNGVRIVLKPFDSLSSISNKLRDNISFHGFTSKGVSCFPKKDYYSALNSTEIIRNSGVNGMNRFELEKYFRDKDLNLRISPYINYNEAGIKGNVKLKDLTTALQLMYLYFTAPNKNSLAFKDWKIKSSSSLVMKTINEDAFRSKIRDIIGDGTLFPNNHNSLESVNRTDMEQAFDIYQNVFGNAEDFTFVFTGDFKKDKILALTRKYLGNLPTNKKEKCKTINKPTSVDLPASYSLTIPSIEFMQQIKGRLVYLSPLDNKNLNWKEEIKLKLLQQMMSTLMMQKIRYKSKAEQQTYFIGVYANSDKSRLFNEIFIEFSSRPKDTDQIIQQVKEFVESFKNNVVDVEFLEQFINEKLQSMKAEKISGRQVSGKIHDYYKSGYPWRSVKQEVEYIKSLTPSDILNTAQQLFNRDPFEFKMLNKKSQQ
ncbi:peptidase M16 [Galbibacter marinus]|uniref:Peptidase M16 n=1 Tax=Galbibacter marinus TaxID=555500 RepID=K2PVP4_9FLAO|nr:M16 family metallopeptidase [Galbibacter marinus]EKF55579.1 peptidase M16 [Galbibacter marinus]